jgi:hypothetical protein
MEVKITNKTPYFTTFELKDGTGVFGAITFTLNLNEYPYGLA